MTDTQDPTLKRLYFRSQHRGSKESDILLSAYADTHLPTLDANERRIYEDFLEENDLDIWDWLTEKAPFPPQYAFILQKLVP